MASRSRKLRWLPHSNGSPSPASRSRFRGRRVAVQAGGLLARILAGSNPASVTIQADRPSPDTPTVPKLRTAVTGALAGDSPTPELLSVTLASPNVSEPPGSTRAYRRVRPLLV